MQIAPENTSRKLDPIGRVTLPKSLRDRWQLVEGDELELFVGIENDRQYILLSRPVDKTAQARAAAKVLCELGLGSDIPMLDSIAYGDFELVEEAE